MELMEARQTAASRILAATVAARGRRNAARWAPLRRASLAFAVLARAALVSAAPVQGAANRRAPRPNVLLVYQGRPITYSDESGVPYAAAVRAIDAARTQFGGATMYDYGVDPFGAQPWGFDRKHPAASLLRAARQALLRKFLRYQLWRRFCAKYHPDDAKYIRLSAMSKLIRESAEAVYRLDGVFHNAVVRHWSARQTLDDYGRKFPGVARVEAARFIRPAFLRRLRLTAGFVAARCGCAPAWISATGRAAPWFGQDQQRNLFKLQLGCLIAARRGRYVRLANLRSGSFNFCLMTGLVSEKRAASAVAEIVQRVGDPNGRIHGRALNAANAGLAALGSPTTIWISNAPGPLLKIQYGVNIFHKGKLRRLFYPLRASQGKYVCLFQTRTPPVFHGRFYGPGSEIFGLAQTTLLMPLARAMLKHCRPGPGLALPTARWLAANIQDGDLEQGKAGGAGMANLPTVIIGHPWRGPPIHLNPPPAMTNPQRPRKNPRNPAKRKK